VGEDNQWITPTHIMVMNLIVEREARHQGDRQKYSRLMLPHIFTQSAIDPGLITFILQMMIFEPVHKIRIQPQRDLLLNRSIKHPTLGICQFRTSGKSLVSISASGKAVKASSST
jgi:hypothetical protein